MYIQDFYNIDQYNLKVIYEYVKWYINVDCSEKIHFNNFTEMKKVFFKLY